MLLWWFRALPVDYRYYLLDEDGRILAGDWISAPDEGGAVRVAHDLRDATADVCAGVEVWQGTQCIWHAGAERTGSDPGGRDYLSGVQGAALDLESRLKQSAERALYGPGP